MKKLLVIICILALLSALPLTAFAEADVYTEGTLYYTIANESVTIVGCFGKLESITVPASIAGYPVNTIASGAFTGNKYLKTLYLPDTITSIQGGAIGSGIAVVYNANTDQPQSYPTDLILGVAPEVAPTTETEQQGQSQDTSSQNQSNTPASTGSSASGQTTVEDDAPATPAPTSIVSSYVAPDGGDVIAESDVDDDAEDVQTPGSEAAPAVSDKPETTQEPAEGSGTRQPAKTNTLLYGLGVMGLLIVVISVVLLRKKGGRA